MKEGRNKLDADFIERGITVTVKVGKEMDCQPKAVPNGSNPASKEAAWNVILQQVNIFLQQFYYDLLPLLPLLSAPIKSSKVAQINSSSTGHWWCQLSRPDFHKRKETPIWHATQCT